MIHVYFIQSGHDGPIKIGLAGDPQRRLEMLQTGNPEPLVLLATQPGAVELERDLHARFAAGRIRGEWFDASTPGLLDEIERAQQALSERYVTRREIAERTERVEARAVRLALNGNWDEAQRLISSVPPETMTES